MSICGWIILGGLAGWIASMITGRNDQMGCITNIFIGIVGAFIGGAIVALLGGTGAIGFNLFSLVVAVLGAVVLLVVVGMIRKAAT